MMNATYLITCNDDWCEQYMSRVEEDYDEDIEHDDANIECENGDGLQYDRQYENHITIHDEKGGFYLDGLDGTIEHVVQESDGAIHFTFEADADNDGTTHYGRGWVSLRDKLTGRIYIHDAGFTSFKLEKSENTK